MFMYVSYTCTLNIRVRVYVYIELYFNTKIKDCIDLLFKKLLKTSVQSFKLYSLKNSV